MGTREEARPLQVGLIGAGIQRSLSPAMHEAEAHAQGLALRYRLIDLDREPDGAAALPRLLRDARASGFAGLNVTYPCKQAVLAWLDRLSDDAVAMGAVNTVVFRDGLATGHNTDGSGWRWGIERTLPDADLSRVMLLGAGGAGSAIAHAVVAMDAAALTIVDEDHARAVALARKLAERYGNRTIFKVHHDASQALAESSGLIHASPTGMDKLPGLPLDVTALRREQWVSEVVYFPLETALLRAARARGCRVADGGGMAVGQALGAFNLFTGRAADPQRMDALFRRLVGERSH